MTMLYRRSGKMRRNSGRSTPNTNMDAFAKAAKPLMQWMAENLHPHYVAIVTSTEAQLLEGTLMSRTTRFIQD